MLQAHSLLWHYLWVAPDVLVLVLCVFLWKRGLIRQYPAFFVFALLNGVGELGLYAADLLPSVSGQLYYRLNSAELILEAALKFAVMGEIFSKLFGAYESLARLGRNLIRWLGAVLVFAAAIAAAFAPAYRFSHLILMTSLLTQSTFFVECGVLVFIFLLSAYFHLHWPNQLFGIALGLGISACVHLATWGLIANAALPNSTRVLLAMLNGAAFHLAVGVWFYYLLVPERVRVETPAPLPEDNLAVWNRELERLLQR